MLVKKKKKCENRCKLRIPYTNRTGSCPEFLAFLELNKFLDNIAPSNGCFTEKTSLGDRNSSLRGS